MASESNNKACIVFAVSGAHRLAVAPPPPVHRAAGYNVGKEASAVFA